MRRLSLIAVIVGLAGTLHAQQGDLPAFDVVSIKQTSAPFQESSGILPTPGRFTLAKAPASLLIGYAYSGEFDEMRGLPDWNGKEHYDVNAPIPANTPRERVQQMVKRLLDERFHLKVHVDEAEREVLALTRINPTAPLPKGFEKVDVDCDALRASGQPRPAFNRDNPPPCSVANTGLEVLTGGAPLEDFGRMLRGVVGRQIVDRTGLEGNYRLIVRYTPAGRGFPDPTDERPEITTALREQAGLKLAPIKITAKILVVDRFDRPEPN